jgi:hypothetical protein
MYTLVMHMVQRRPCAHASPRASSASRPTPARVRATARNRLA